jgi:DNA repair protein RadC
MSTHQSDTQRYQRYERVLAAAITGDEFSLAHLRCACAEESPAFVTSVVRQLEKDGVVERCGLKTKPSFRWRTDRQAFAPKRWIDSKIYRNQMTRAPLDDRPRERLLLYGAPALRTAELLAILVRSGMAGESALQAGERIATKYADRLEQLPDAARLELKDISRAVGTTAFCQIMAGIELGRRVAGAMVNQQQRAAIKSTYDALAYCRDKFGRLAVQGAQEEFHVITLDTKNKVIDVHQVSVGLLDQTVVHPREVFRPAIKDAAKTVILVHNHPSGDPTPSDKDQSLTQRLEEAGQTLGIQVLDHIIVARDGAVSIRELAAQ